MQQNPIAERRHVYGLTQSQLAIRAGTARQIIIRLEQGTLTTVPAGVLSALSDTSSDRLILRNAYSSWQHHTRRSARGSLRVPPTYPVGENPHRYLREYDSLKVVDYCKLLCIPSSAVHRVERTLPYPNGGCHQIPLVIIQALTEAGFPIVPLNEAFRVYRNLPHVR